MVRGTRIRRASQDDAPRITDLCGQLGYPEQEEDVERRLARLLLPERHAIFVAEAEGEGVLGWLHVYVEQLLVSELRAELGGLVVEERARGARIGGELMEAAEAWARDKGCSLLRVRTNVIRARAHGFYERLGYSKAKTQHVYEKEL